MHETHLTQGRGLDLMGVTRSGKRSVTFLSWPNRGDDLNLNLNLNQLSFPVAMNLVETPGFLSGEVSNPLIEIARPSVAEEEGDFPTETPLPFGRPTRSRRRSNRRAREGPAHGAMEAGCSGCSDLDRRTLIPIPCQGGR